MFDSIDPEVSGRASGEAGAPLLPGLEQNKTCTFSPRTGTGAGYGSINDGVKNSTSVGDYYGIRIAPGEQQGSQASTLGLFSDQKNDSRISRVVPSDIGEGLFQGQVTLVQSGKDHKRFQHSSSSDGSSPMHRGNDSSSLQISPSLALFPSHNLSETPISAQLLEVDLDDQKKIPMNRIATILKARQELQPFLAIQKAASPSSSKKLQLVLLDAEGQVIIGKDCRGHLSEEVRKATEAARARFHKALRGYYGDAAGNFLEDSAAITTQPFTLDRVSKILTLVQLRKDFFSTQPTFAQLSEEESNLYQRIAHDQDQLEDYKRAISPLESRAVGENDLLLLSSNGVPFRWYQDPSALLPTQHQHVRADLKQKLINYYGPWFVQELFGSEVESPQPLRVKEVQSLFHNIDQLIKRLQNTFQRYPDLPIRALEAILLLDEMMSLTHGLSQQYQEHYELEQGSHLYDYCTLMAQTWESRYCPPSQTRTVGFVSAFSCLGVLGLGLLCWPAACALEMSSASGLCMGAMTKAHFERDNYAQAATEEMDQLKRTLRTSLGANTISEDDATKYSQILFFEMLHRLHPQEEIQSFIVDAVKYDLALAGRRINSSLMEEAWLRAHARQYTPLTMSSQPIEEMLLNQSQERFLGRYPYLKEMEGECSNLTLFHFPRFYTSDISHLLERMSQSFQSTPEELSQAATQAREKYRERWLRWWQKASEAEYRQLHDSFNDFLEKKNRFLKFVDILKKEKKNERGITLSDQTLAFLENFKNQIEDRQRMIASTLSLNLRVRGAPRSESMQR